MENVVSKDIFFQSVEIVINSAKSLILDEWDGKIFKYTDANLIDDISFLEFTSEFLIDNNNDAKIYISANRKTISALALKLYGMDISVEEGDEMIQDSINELLNFFIGNAARELEKLGLDFIESLIPTAANFEEIRKKYENYKVIIPITEGDIVFVFSAKNLKQL